MVSRWNAAHPDEKVTAQEIPAGKTSEEVIGAAITAGNAPCLVFNTCPAAVPAVPEAGRPGRRSTASPAAPTTSRRASGGIADQYKSPDGKFYQMPWKSNPVMIFYNKDLFKKAGLDPDNPPLATYDEFLATSKKIVDSGAAQAAICAGADERVLPVLVRLLPAVRRRDRRQAAGRGRQGHLRRRRPGKAVANFWAQMYAEGSRRKENYNGDSFADGKAAMAIVGPWAIAVYKDKVNWGVVPVPTTAGMPADQIHTFSDAKNIGDLLRLQEPGHRLGRR